MAFPKGYDNGHRFSSDNQPTRRRGVSYLSYSSLVRRCKERNVKPPTRNEFKEMLSYCFVATRKDAQEIISDENAMLGESVPLRGLVAKNGYDVFKDIADRVYGKPVQQIDATTNGKDLLAMNPFSMRIIDDASQIQHTVYDRED